MSFNIESQERKYRKITLDERENLITMVIKEKRKIAEAARYLDINPSTARIIVQNYKEEGRIYEKKSDRLARRKNETIEQVPRCSPQINVDSHLYSPIPKYEEPQTYFMDPMASLCFQWWPVTL